MPGSLEDAFPISAAPVDREPPPGSSDDDGELNGEGGESGSVEKGAPAALNVKGDLVENEELLSLELPVEHKLESSAYAALTATLAKQSIMLWSGMGWFPRESFNATARSTHPTPLRTAAGYISRPQRQGGFSSTCTALTNPVSP